MFKFLCPAALFEARLQEPEQFAAAGTVRGECDVCVCVCVWIKAGIKRHKMQIKVQSGGARR
jgi:hypothetical protein